MTGRRSLPQARVCLHTIQSQNRQTQYNMHELPSQSRIAGSGTAREIETNIVLSSLANANLESDIEARQSIGEPRDGLLVVRDSPARELDRQDTTILAVRSLLQSLDDDRLSNITSDSKVVVTRVENHISDVRITDICAIEVGVEGDIALGHTVRNRYTETSYMYLPLQQSSWWDSE